MPFSPARADLPVRHIAKIGAKTRKRVNSADAERLLDWGKRVLTAERLEDVFTN